MSYVSYDFHKSLTDYFNDVLTTYFVDTNRLRHVTIGEKTKLTDMPFAFIIPRRVLIPDATVASVTWEGVWDIVAIDKDSDVEAGQEKIWKLGFDIYDQFMSDRQMGGLADLFPQQVEPDYERTDDYVLHWILLRWMARAERSY